MSSVKHEKAPHLPFAFAAKQAKELGYDKRDLAALIDAGRIERVARGLYAHAGAPVDYELLEARMRTDRATVCLESALARSNLIDSIPVELNVAIPNTQRPPKTSRPTRWHKFDPTTFDIGRDIEIEIADGIAIAMYNPVRSIVDAYRVRNIYGVDIAHQSLKAWINQPGNNPAEIVRMARHFPKSEPALSAALQILW